jgi:hypothetical protein
MANLSYDKVTRVIAKSLKMTPESLRDSFAPATLDELPSILQFRQEFSHANLRWDDKDYLIWRYDFSPVTSLQQDKSNRLWRVKIDNEIIGIIGLDYAEFLFRGEIKALHNPLDLLVRADMDGLGFGVWMSLVLEQHYSFLFAMGATRHSHSIVKKLFHPMPDMGAWKLLLDTRQFIAKKIKNSLLQWFLSRSLNLYLRINLFFKKSGHHTECEIKPLTDFAPFDKDLHQLHADYQGLNVLMRHRDARFLNWRFINNPRRHYSVMAAFVDGQLKAYAVYHFNQKNYLEIDDLFSAASNQGYLASLLYALIELACEKNSVLISFVAHANLWQSTLKKSGFKWRDDGHLFSVFINDSSQDQFKAIELWLLTSADTHSEGF